MQPSLLTLNRGEIDYRKVFLYILAFELMILAVMLTGDTFLMAGSGAVVLLPLILLFLPKEPVIGIPLMFVATGLDFFGTITEQSEIFTFTYFHIVMVLTFLSVIMNQLLRREIEIPSVTLWPPVILFLIIMSVSLLYTPLFMEGFMEFARLCVLLLLTFTMIVCVDTLKRIKFVVWCYILVPALVAIYTVYEILTQGAFFASQVSRVAVELGIPVYRSTGTFHNPNQLGCFLMIGVTIGFGMLLMKGLNWMVRLILIASISITVIGIVASFSRTAWLSTGVAVLFIILLHRRWSYFFILTAIVAIVLFILSIKFPHILLSTFDRFATILNPFSEESSLSRIALMRSGIRIWMDHPIFGVGVGSYPFYMPQYIDPDMPAILLWVVDPHTLQIKILAEEGIIGFTIATWFFFTVVVDSIRSLKTMRNEYLRHIQVGFIALFIGFIVNFIFASDILNNIFWITVGIIYAILHVGKHEN
ncbi:O-antigen ligase family protein [Candidatus Latescibacterota bacterium]